MRRHWTICRLICPYYDVLGDAIEYSLSQKPLCIMASRSTAEETWREKKKCFQDRSPLNILSTLNTARTSVSSAMCGRVLVVAGQRA